MILTDSKFGDRFELRDGTEAVLIRVDVTRNYFGDKKVDYVLCKNDDGGTGLYVYGESGRWLGYEDSPYDIVKKL